LIFSRPAPEGVVNVNRLRRRESGALRQIQRYSWCGFSFHGVSFRGLERARPIDLSAVKPMPGLNRIRETEFIRTEDLY
jgi:hypothetical protein